MMRKIAKGSQQEMDTQHLSQRSFNEVAWGNVLDGLDKGTGPRNVNGIYNTE